MEPHVSEHPVGGHEENTVQLQPVILFAIILVVVSAFSFAGVWFMLDFLKMNQARKDAQVSPLANLQQLPPAPRLQVSPGQELNQLRQAENVMVNSYHWIDKDAGVVGIPIEQAIKVLAQKGLPTRSDIPKE